MSTAHCELAHPTQTINVTIRTAGAHEVIVDSHGHRQQRGAYVSVMAAGVVIYMYTARAAEAYSNAWIDLAASPVLKLLPFEVETGKADRLADVDSPAVVITAHDYDQAKHKFIPAQKGARAAAAIRVGQVAWLFEDRAAYQSFLGAWQTVHNLIPLVFDRIRDHQPIS